jgi:hypothetical protein
MRSYMKLHTLKGVARSRVHGVDNSGEDILLLWKLHSGVAVRLDLSFCIEWRGFDELFSVVSVAEQKIDLLLP